jgi:hypothetical protein
VKRSSVSGLTKRAKLAKLSCGGYPRHGPVPGVRHQLVSCRSQAVLSIGLNSSHLERNRIL